MKRSILILFFLLASMAIFAQSGIVSHDGKTLAFASYDKQMNINLYDIASGKPLLKIALPDRQVSRMFFSPDDNILAVLANSTLRVYDACTGKEITRFYNVTDFKFTGSKQALLITNLEVHTYDFGTKKDNYYILPYDQTPEKAIATKDGKFIAARTKQNKIFFWRYGQKDYLHSLQATDVFAYNNVFIVRKNLADDVKFSVFYPASGQKAQITETKSITAKNISQNYLQSGWNPALRAIRNSNNGRFTGIFLTQSNKIMLVIYDLIDNKTVTTQTFNTNDIPRLYWTDSTVVWEFSNLQATEYNLNTGKKTQLFWKFANPQNISALLPEIQRNGRIFSNDLHFLAYEFQKSGKNYLLFKYALINKPQVTFPGAYFIAFTNDSKAAFLWINGVVFILRLNDLQKALIENIKPKIYKLGTVPVEVKPEPAITKDNPPAGYKYIFSTGTKPVTQVDSQKLKVLFRGMDITQSQLNLKLNLIDQNGNLITGATDPQWLYLWCKLLIMNNQLKAGSSQFTVHEVREQEPTAYAIALDMSGSMGKDRANAVQAGAWELMKNKRPEDAYILLKYDDKVRTYGQLSTDVSQYEKILKNTGLQGFGGRTAINDAAYIAIRKLYKANYPKKVLILFTDGQENSSYRTKEQVIKLAKQTNVEIFTIGFGRNIDSQYLKDLAYSTGGSFYHIYKTEDLLKIFKDIDMKRRYYYNIQFNTKQTGKYIALLQLCENFKYHDSLIVSFNNSPNRPPDRASVDVNPPLSPKEKQILKQSMIPRKPPETPVTDEKTLQEFNSIDFPNIYFAFDSDSIIRSEEKGIIQIANFMKRHPQVYLLIEGHTDSVGTYEYNIDLSKRRAEAAKRLLVKYGIAPGRIFTKGYGYTRPLATNKTGQGRAKNRRIEFKIFCYPEQQNQQQ